MTQQCSQCKKSVNPGARFCANCGAQLLLNPGDVLQNRFQIERILGEGGFGAVYLARDIRLDRECVVKQMLLPNIQDYPSTKEWQAEVNNLQSSFKREAHSLVSLNQPGHPNIPEIYDSFAEPTGNYLVMKYIGGEDLEQCLMRTGKPLPWREAVGIVLQVVSALEYMHNRKPDPVLHRDIKPANILLDKADRVWLVDFGLSKAQPTMGVGGLGKTTAAGTPGYAPLEQWLQQAVPASDIYSLGATLHHLLTGRDPRDVFTTFDLPEAQRQHGNFPALRSLNGALPVELDAAVVAAVRDKPTSRPTSVQWKVQLEKLVHPQVAVTTFTWKDGTTCSSPDQLSAVSERCWDEAKDYLYGGMWLDWFENDLRRNDIAAIVRSVVSKHKNQDVGLDILLRELDISFSQPELNLFPKALNFGIVPWKGEKTIELEIQNTGSGCLYGQIDNLPKWLQISPVEFATQDHQKISITADAGNLTPSTAAYNHQLDIVAAHIGPQKLPVSLVVPEPQMEVAEKLVDLGSAYEGQTLKKSFVVRNRGGSAFRLLVKADKKWVKPNYSRTHVEPGGDSQVTLQTDTSGMKVGQHQSEITVLARAGGFSQQESLHARVKLPWLKTIWYRFYPFSDLAILGAIVVGSLFWLLFHILLWVAGLHWLIPIGVLGIAGAIVGGVIDDFDNWFPLALGGILGIGTGYGLLKGIVWLTNLIGSSDRALLGGIVVGVLLGIGSRLRVRPAKSRTRKPASMPTRGYLTIVAFLISFGAGIFWAVQEGPKFIYYQLGLYQSEKENWFAAQDYFDQVFVRDPSYRDSKYQMVQSAYNGGISCLEIEQWLCAEEAFRFVQHHDPNFLDVNTQLLISQAEPHYRQGLTYLDSGKWAQAQAEFETVIAVEPTYKEVQEQIIIAQAEPYYLQGLEDLSNERWEQAETSFEEVLAIDVNYKDTQGLLVTAQVEKYYQAGLEYEREENWQDAIDAFKEVMTVTLDYKNTSEHLQNSLNGFKAELYQTGVDFTEAGRWEQAAEPFAQLRTLEPNYKDLPTRSQQLELRDAFQNYYAQQWVTASAIHLYDLEGHTDEITSLIFDPVGTTLISSSMDGQIRFWDASTTQLLDTWDAHEGGVNALAVANYCHIPQGSVEETCDNLLASGGGDRSVKIWNLDSGELLYKLTLHDGSVTDVSFSPNGEYVVSVSPADGMRVWEIGGGFYRYLIEPRGNDVVKAVYHPVDFLLLASGETEIIDIFSVGQTWDFVIALDAHESQVHSVVVSPENSIVASGDQQGAIYLWDISMLNVEGGKQTLQSPYSSVEIDAEITELIYYPTSQLLAVLTSEGIQIWEIPPVTAEDEADTQAVEILELESQLNTIEFNSDGWLLAAGRLDGKISIYSVDVMH